MIPELILGSPLPLSPEEAGRYLETYKAYEQKPADLLKEKVDQDFLSIVRLPRCALPCSSAMPGTPVLSFRTAVPCQGPLSHEFPHSSLMAASKQCGELPHSSVLTRSPVAEVSLSNMQWEGERGIKFDWCECTFPGQGGALSPAQFDV